MRPGGAAFRVAVVAATLLGPALQAPAREAGSAGMAAGVAEMTHGKVVKLLLGGANRVPGEHQQAAWTLHVYDPAEQRTLAVDAIAGNEQFEVVEKPAEKGRQVWELISRRSGDPLGRVEARIRTADAMVDFEAVVHVLDDRYIFERLVYPQYPLAALDDPDDDQLLVPIAHGQLIEQVHAEPAIPYGRGDDMLDAVYRGYYPSKWAALQMAYYFDASGGLLFMTPDAQRQIKEFVIDRDPQGRLRANFVHYLGEPAADGRIAIPYPARIHWVDGDWYDAAQIYRDWAGQQAWARVPLDQRPDVPDWFAGNPSWVRIPKDGAAWDVKTQWPLQWAEAVGTPMAIHWYGWNKDDGLSKENPLPAAPADGLAAAVEAYHEAGLYVMPYMNARLAELDAPGWERFDDVVMRDRAGRLSYIEQWGSNGNRFAVGDLSTPEWQSAIIDYTRHQLQLDMDAIYHDQQGVWSHLVLDPQDPASPGDPLAWQAGLEQLYTSLRRDLSDAQKKPAFVAEYLNEALIPSLHGALTVNASMLMRHRTVPLFEAVYHEHFAAIGWAYDRHELDTDPDRYLHRMMSPFVLGAQPGRIAPGREIVTLIEEHPTLVACYRQAVDLRRAYPQMLGYGKLLRQPQMQDLPLIGVPQINATSDDDPTPWPAIMGGLFSDRAAQPTGLAVFVNWTASPQTGRATLDISELGPRVALRDPEGNRLGAFDGPSITIPVQLQPHSVQAVLLEPAP